MSDNGTDIAEYDNDDLRTDLRKLATDCLLEEIRFVDTKDLELLPEFKDRQPKDIMPNARCVIISSIYIGAFFLEGWEKGTHVKTSRLTLSGFYFNVVDPLKPISDYLIANGYEAVICDGFVEEKSIPLKQVAAKAGLGWIGKNSLLLNEKYGSWQALGAIITNADIGEIYAEMKNHCGTCRECIKACPAEAIEDPGNFIRRKCLSHLLEDEVVEKDVIKINPGYFVECDICQLVCPWNSKHISTPLETPRSKLFKKDELERLFSYEYIRNIDEKEYKEKIVPHLSGIELSYKMFMRNLKL
ncbi:MAG: 4Fe-4S double cluster binding domain-containing protein [Eubacteriales bacterium]